MRYNNRRTNFYAIIITIATSLRMPRTDRGKMDEPSVFTPQFAELDAQNDTSSTPSATSDTGADNVINTKTDSTQVQGEFCLERENSAAWLSTCRADVRFFC